VVSDDFSAPVLDTGVWTFVNPLDDASVAMTGNQVEIGLPASGVVHDVWVNSNLVPRLMQAVDDTDFEIEAKFESALFEGFQSQGILIEEDPDHVIRVEFHHYGGSTNIYVATIMGSTATTRTFASVPLSAPMHMRVGRSFNTWTVDYSLDGSSWTTATAFTQSMTVAAVGVFAGNGVDTAHTAVVDYFFDTASPIEPEDAGLLAVVVDAVGAGSVVRDPDLAGYTAGSVVTLTATPEPGWLFDSWSGDVSDTVNPVSVTVNDHVAVTAVFVEEADLTAPAISDVGVVAEETTATITWSTDEAATSVVEYGLTAGYGDSTRDPTYKTAHSITLTGLLPDTSYHFEVVSEDASGNVGASGDMILTTVAPEPSVVRSDDFSGPGLDTEVWTFVNPFGDASVAMTGHQAEIVIPATPQVHDVWTYQNFVPRLMQAVEDTDFEVEAKFESGLSEGFQSQGILIEEDVDHVIRVEFHHFGGRTKLYVATLFGDTATTRVIRDVTLSVPNYLRVGRVGNGWTVRYSLNGSSWTTGTTFSQAMSVSSVGVFAGSGADTAHTVTVDYVFDTASPIEPEDAGLLTVSTDVVGQGSVVVDPDLAIYSAGSDVDLTAVADTGWLFDHWSGDVTGSVNPVSVTVNDHMTVTAVFVQEADETAPAVFDIEAAVDEVSATITWTTDEAASSLVDYGLSGSYTDSVWDPVYKTSHSLVLTGLDSGTVYHFEVVSEDAAGNVGASGDLTFTTDAIITSGIVSDEFDSGVLDTDVWTYVDPFSDSALLMTGSHAEIAIPANGQVHDIWTFQYDVPRLVQAANDADFEVEAKFDSVLDAGFQSQGIVIEQDADHVIRVEFHHFNGQTKVFAATLFGSSASIRTIRTVALSPPMYLRVSRQGDRFTVRYSLNGTSWSTATTFTQAMEVTAVGVFAGNGSANAHTAAIDYFVETSGGAAKAETLRESDASSRSEERIEERRKWRTGEYEKSADDQ
jgi:regulation of enolase protein 1 (concanavalin A-like superfamily)